MPKLLITGATGNIGAYLMERAQQLPSDWQTVGVARHPDPTVAGDIQTVDLLDPNAVSRFFAEQTIDIVIHTAAPAYNATKYREDPFGVFRHDLGCLLNVLDHAQQVKRFIYLSSATVYEGATDTPFTEDMTERIPPPLSPVGLAKQAGERAVRLFCQQHHIPFTIWRLFNVVSPRESHATPGAHVYVDFYRSLFVEQVPTLEIFGGGNQVRNFTWVEDAADAIIRFLDDARTDNQIFNLGGNEPKTLLELKDAMIERGKARGLLPVDYQPEIKTGGKFFGTEAAQRIPSLEKMTQTLDWTPKTNFQTCIERFIEAKQGYARP